MVTLRSSQWEQDKPWGKSGWSYLTGSSSAKMTKASGGGSYIGEFGHGPAMG
jgi:hypothetical protein